ncbi:MAG: diguanylate cyclase [Nitrospirae bacterium]|nr:diguanylate cyclase [Nitrospirota bacterium]
MAETPALNNLFSSEEWKEYFQILSKITDLNIIVYDESVTPLFITKENPICNSMKSNIHGSTECTAFCNKLILESLKLNEPLIYKCYLKIINFSVPVEYMGEKAAIVGRGGHSSYEDFAAFLKIAHDMNIQNIPITAPLSFIHKNRLKLHSQYVHKTINQLLNNTREKNKLTEKISRLTTVLDTDTFKKLSENAESTYRYIIDTLESIIGPVSTGIMVFDRQTSEYKTAYSSGPYRDTLIKFNLGSESPIIQKLSSSKVHMLSLEQEQVSDEIKKFLTTEQLEETKALYLFPFFTTGTLEGIIWVFDGRLPQENIKIIHAFCDYIAVAFENSSLRRAIDKKRDEILGSILDLGKSIAPVLKWDNLLETILEKATQLLKAEQGSLMLMNYDTAELLVEAKKGLHDITAEKIKLKKGEGIAGRVLESGEPLLVEDVENDPRINQKNKPRYKTKSFVSVPLRIEDKVAGVLNVSDKIMGGIFNENDLRLLQSFTANAAIAIERNLFYKQTEELKKLSVTDPLTGILNRRFMNNRLTEEIARFNRYKQPFSFLMLDIDGFKKYNTVFGHIGGDKILKILAATLTGALRQVDIAARYGGDEFVIILPQTPKADAINIAERLREHIETSPILQQAELLPEKLTVSIGLASYPEDAASITELMEKVDQALYLAKDGGRNRLGYI